MALFKNLYLDFSYLNPFKKKEKEKNLENDTPSFVSNSSYQELSNISYSSNFNGTDQNPKTTKKIKDLPQISRKLLDNAKESKEREEVLQNRAELPKISKIDIIPPPNIGVVSSLELNNHIKPIEKSEISSLSNNPPIKNPPSHEEAEGAFSAEGVFSIDNKDASFFNELYDNLSKDEANMHKTLSNHVLNKNLLDEMQNFWYNKKGEINQAAFTQALKSDLVKKMNALQDQEIEWQKMQLQYEKLKDELTSKEIIIENNIKQLTKSFKRLHLTSNINEEHYFILSNGNKLKSLQELLDGLKVMDSEVFNFHVNNYKNDFANWVNDVMGLSELAKNMRFTKNKEEMHGLIEKWSTSF